MSDATGHYKFSSAPIGQVKVSRVFPSGYKLSNPSPGTSSHDVLVTVLAGKNATANMGSVAT
jgi:hypothetical protein